MEYLRKTNKIFKLWNILINAIVITLGIVVVDYLNIPSQIIKNDSILISSIFIALIMLSFIEILKSKKYKLFVAKSINILDKCVFMTLFIELIYSIYLINDFKTYKFTILLIFFGIILCIFIWRLLYINNLLKKQKSKKSNMFDLKEFIETDIKINTSKNLVLFSENDVKYDLLNRGMFVDYIASLIKYCNPEKSFVFALNGAWGSGKSTILNLVKNTINSEEMIIIDDFDPWKYNDSETLFRGFYDSITKNENFNFDYTLYKKIYNVYKVLILGNDNILNKINFDLHFKDNNYSVNELKNIISTYLKINNKKVVFIIDNIDRLNKEQILVIFKTVSNLFDFDNFVYILSFDEKRVEKIFENELKIDSNYLNKIINSNVYLPKVNNNIISEIAIRTIKKMYLYYNIKIDNDEEIRFINMFSQLSSKFQDIRELKRFLNYISAFMQSSDIQELINMSDFIMIQLIKYLNINLYNTIYNTPMFFISEDINLSSIYQYDFFFAEKFNTMAKEFYQKLFNEEENKEYKTVLANLFPYINNFASGYQIRTTIPYNHDQNLYNTSVINKRICNGRYFEHYFDLTPNKYSELLKEVNEFIENFNNEQNIEKIELYYEIFIMLDNDNQRFKLEILDKSLNKIREDKIINLIDIIYDKIEKLNINSKGATMLGTRERCITIFADVLNIVNINDAKKRVEKFINNVYNLLDIDTLIFWLNPEKQHNKNLSQELFDFAKDTFTTKLNSIIHKRVDVMSNKKYGQFSISIFKKYSIKKEEIKEYVNSILNKENIFRFLKNFMAEWVGSGYSYEFNENDLFELISKESIDKIIKSIDFELNIDQKLILDIYDRKINQEKSFSIPISYENL